MKAFILLMAFGSVPALAAGKKAHEHGVSTVSIAIDKNMLLIGAEITGEALLGFERKPKTEAEKKTYDDAMKTLKEKPFELFILPGELGCKVSDVLVSDHLTEADHGEVEVDYTLSCDKTASGSTLKLGLLKVFPKIKRVKVQILSDATQSGRVVTSDQEPIKL